jgi:2-polyprenyl-6-methoxyphenol hydroxylase-like FAD-dependent oxidoreductase
MIYDVAIIGSGLAGSTLAAILARQGLSVLMLEAGSHPRFAIGESVVPEFGARAKLMADLFDVPELGSLANFQELRHHVSGSSGVKRSFTFMSHREGTEHRPGETCQFQTMTYPLGPDSHLYRPEVDAWLTAVAVRYGVTYRDRTRVEDVTIEDDGVTLTLGPDTAAVRARFLCDGSGFRSILAEKMGLRIDPSGFATDSRTLFTHMTGVGITQASSQIFCPKTITAKQCAIAQQLVDQTDATRRLNVGGATLRAGWGGDWRKRVDPANKGPTDPFAKPKYSQIQTKNAGAIWSGIR